MKGVQTFNLADNDISGTRYTALKAMGISLMAAATAAAARALLEIDDELASLTAAEIQQLQAIGATTISADQWALLGGLGSLTAAEIAQLETIGATTISADQWALLGGLGSLTASEIAQLETIGATTISAAQWALLGFLSQQTEITDELTTITHTAPGTPDYAVQDLVQPAGYGFVSKDEGNSVLAVIANLQARVNELETALVTNGLLADAD